MANNKSEIKTQIIDHTILANPKFLNLGFSGIFTTIIPLSRENILKPSFKVNVISEGTNNDDKC